MANVELELTVIGNLTNLPELRFTPSGAAVCNFTIAHTPRVFNRQTNEWADGTTTFMRCSVWREQAENVAQSLDKGMGVIAQGRLKSRTYQTKEGEDRTVLELEVSAIGPSLERATAVVTKAGRSSAPQAGQGGSYDPVAARQAQGGTWGGQAGAQQPAEDPWATPGVSSNSGTTWGNGSDAEPPF